MLGVVSITSGLFGRPSVDAFREAAIAHQTHNTFLHLELKKLETEMQQQEKLFRDTIARLRNELSHKINQNNMLVKQQGEGVASKIIQELECKVDHLSQKYFVSLAVGGKLQHFLAGEQCNVDALDLYEKAKSEQILDIETWPVWIADQLTKESKPVT